MGGLKKAIVIIGIVLSVFPFVFLALLSIAQDWRFPFLLPSYYQSARWAGIFTESNDLLKSLALSFAIAIMVAAFSTIAGFMISRTISLNVKRKLLLFACYFPLALSPVIYSLLINHYFILLNLSGTITGVIIAQLLIAVPFSILLLSSFWSGYIRSLEDIAATLGSNFSQSFFKVLLPVARPQLLVCFFQTFLISWFEFGLTTIIGVGKVQTLTLKVFEYIGEANMYYAALSSCIIILPPALFLWVNKKFVFSNLN